MAGRSPPSFAGVDLGDSMDVALALRAFVFAARQAGWEINLGIEWRDGQCFNLSGRQKPRGQPAPSEDEG